MGGAQFEGAVGQATGNTGNSTADRCGEVPSGFCPRATSGEVHRGRRGIVATLAEDVGARFYPDNPHPGADVFMKDYKASDSAWDHLGQSPLEKLRVPAVLFRWKIEKKGFATVEQAGLATAF